MVLTDSRITKTDVFYQLLKIAIAITLLGALGLIAGALVYIALQYSVDFAIRKIFKLHPLNATDQSVWLDTKSNRCHIVGSIVFDKCPEQVIREVFINEMTSKWVRLRSKMTKVLDQYYFEELSPMELQKQLNNAMEVRHDIKTMDQMSELISEQQNIEFPEDQLQWHIWFVPNLNDQESLFVMKMHHAIGDGLGILILFATLQDNYSPKSFIQTTEVLSTCKQFIIFLLKPFTLLYAFVFFLFWKTDKNYIKDIVKLAGKKKNAITSVFDVPTLKKIGAMNNKATINDVVLGLTSIGFKEYLRKHEDMSTTSINCFIPFSFRKIPQTPVEHRLENDFTALCFTMQLGSTFEDAVGSVSKQMRAMKKSLYPYGVHALLQVLQSLPSVIGQLITVWVVSKTTVVISNVPGPTVPMVFKGYKTRGFIGMIPGLGDCAFGISAISMGNTLYMAIQADTSYVEDPRELRDIIERNYQEQVKALQIKSE